MAIQGLNITIEIRREIPGADDEVGGATTSTSIVATGVKARISSLKPTAELRVQGIETSRYYSAVIWPATTDIQENDSIVPESGSHEGLEFKVTGIQVDSLPSNSNRAHISVRMQHIGDARTIQ